MMDDISLTNHLSAREQSRLVGRRGSKSPSSVHGRLSHRLWNVSLFMLLGAFALPLQAQRAAPPQAPLTPLPHPEIAPPVVPPLAGPIWPVALSAVVGLLLLALVLWLLFRRKSHAVKQPEPPLQRATALLKSLQGRLDGMSAGDAAHEVSVILRDYLQARYAVPAPYRTTQELYGNPKNAQAREDLRERFQPVAEFYDKLEFAPQPASRAECEKLIASALEVLHGEKPAAETPAKLPPPLPMPFNPANTAG